jgi:ubiquinone/menaquinone biosynthesis C-methylase UbiE
MLGLGVVDNNQKIDWGKTSEDYMLYRPGPPKSLFSKLHAHGIGYEEQSILDLGTGTGVMAIELARNGSKVTGIDISSEQLKVARFVSGWECLDIDFIRSPCEVLPFPDNSFDVIVANQCWLYFDLKKVEPEILRVMKPGAKLVISHFSWLPRQSKIASGTEELMLKYNPSWSAGGYSGKIPVLLEWANQGNFNLNTFFYYDENIPFTHESWLGRIRASRAIGASLEQNLIKAFNSEHKHYLESTVSDAFTVPHRIDVHIYELSKGLI